MTEPTLLLGDCFEVLQTLEAESVDAENRDVLSEEALEDELAERAGDGVTRRNMIKGRKE